MIQLYYETRTCDIWQYSPEEADQVLDWIQKAYESEGLMVGSGWLVRLSDWLVLQQIGTRLLKGADALFSDRLSARRQIDDEDVFLSHDTLSGSKLEEARRKIYRAKASIWCRPIYDTYIKKMDLAALTDGAAKEEVVSEGNARRVVVDESGVFFQVKDPPAFRREYECRFDPKEESS